MRSGSKIRAFRNIAHAGFGHSPDQSKSATGAALTRRRAIRIVAAAAGRPLVIAAVRAAAPPGQLFGWQGEVLGALSELALWHTDAALAQRTILQVRGEIARYEGIFSLYRQDSEISRLNAAGTLNKPSPELLRLVEGSPPPWRPKAAA